MQTIIYLVRHGETDWNKQRRFQGQKDIPLNEIGRLQATKLAEKIINIKGIDVIYSSDLKRAYETAEIIAKSYSTNVLIEEGLRERKFGILEGIKLEDFQVKYPNFNLASMELDREYEIEPYISFKSRIYNTLYNLVNNNLNNTILVVSHGAAINSFLTEISNGEYGSNKTRVTNTSITTVVYNHKDKNWEIIEVNDSSHLEAM